MVVDEYVTSSMEFTYVNRNDHHGTNKKVQLCGLAHHGLGYFHGICEEKAEYRQVFPFLEWFDVPNISNQNI